MLGEFAGTFLFLFFAFAGTQVANTAVVPSEGPDTSRLLYISLCFGFSLAVNAWTFFRISGGLFNPAVNFAMCLVGALSWTRGGLLFVAQMLGAIVTAAVTQALFPGDLAVSTGLGGGTSTVQGLFIEMFLTAQLVFTIFMLAAEKHKATFIAPVGIGLSLFSAELTGVYFTGGSLNPARSFAPCAVTNSFPSYHWIYWLGPLLGATLAASFYKFIKMIEYETANPAADDDIAGPGQVKEHESVTTAVRSSSPEPGARDIPTPGGTTIGSPLRNNWVMDGDGKISSESSSETSTIDTLSTWEALPVIGEGVENNSKANEAGWVEGPDIEQGLGKLKPVILRPGPRISPGSWKWPQ